MGDTSPPTPRMRKVGMADETKVTLAGRIMVGTIIAVLFLVVFILCIHIFARVFWWRRNSGISRRRRFVFAIGDEVPAPSDGLRRGVDPTVMKSLPVVVFSGLEFKDGLKCAVCLGEVVDGEKARILPNCSHGFHVGCIDMWLQSHSNCPMCRTSVCPEASEQFVASQNVTSSSSPKNVLFYRNEARVVRSDEGTVGRLEGSLVIDIPRNNFCSDFSLSMIRSPDQDELRSPLSSRLRSLTTLWSMSHQVAPSGSSTTDTEQEQGYPTLRIHVAP